MLCLCEYVGISVSNRYFWNRLMFLWMCRYWVLRFSLKCKVKVSIASGMVSVWCQQTSPTTRLVMVARATTTLSFSTMAATVDDAKFGLATSRLEGVGALLWGKLYFPRGTWKARGKAFMEARGKLKTRLSSILEKVRVKDFLASRKVFIPLFGELLPRIISQINKSSRLISLVEKKIFHS